MVLTAPAPARGRIDFPTENILATVTDPRGVITYANRAFCQVSGFDPDDLIGAPQSIVRHPDMPRGLFFLCWRKLLAGQPVAAYIKNRARDGGHSWIFALMLPHPDGFLSMRIRPDGALFDDVRRLYDTALAREAEGLMPEDSCRQLTGDIRALGFAGYSEYMTVALGDEIARRARALRREVPARIAVLEDLSDQARSMLRAASALGEGFRNIRNEPVNMRILSNRLETGGASISMISQNYDTMAQEMSANIDRLCSSGTGALAQIWQATGNGCFAMLSALLIRELATDGDAADQADTADRFGRGIIRAHADRMQAQSNDAMAEIQRYCTAIPEISRQLRRRINGLDVVKLLCRVENCRIGSRDAGLTAIIERLEGFHSDTDAMLGDLSKNAMKISQTATGLT